MYADTSVPLMDVTPLLLGGSRTRSRPCRSPCRKPGRLGVFGSVWNCLNGESLLVF